MNIVNLAGATPSGMYGVSPTAPDLMAGGSTPALAAAGGPSIFDNSKPWSPDSPIFWLVGLAGVTLGLIGFATSVHAGPVRAAVQVGAS